MCLYLEPADQHLQHHECLLSLECVLFLCLYLEPADQRRPSADQSGA